MKMRIGLLTIFWICTLGTAIQAPLLCYEFWLLATGVTFSELTIWALLTEHIKFLAWVADLIWEIFGTGFGDWILGLPATLVTFVKLIMGTLIAYWALGAVRKIDSAHDSDGTAQARG